MERPMAGPTVFISYSRKDRKSLERLKEHLGAAVQQELLEVWDDSRIGAGDDWYEQIQTAMSSACAAVLIVTRNFLGSGFIHREEVPRLLERRAKQGMKVVPILFSPCTWEVVPWLKKIMSRPDPMRPLSERRDRVDAELKKIVLE